MIVGVTVGVWLGSGDAAGEANGVAFGAGEFIVLWEIAACTV